MIDKIFREQIKKPSTLTYKHRGRITAVPPQLGIKPISFQIQDFHLISYLCNGRFPGPLLAGQPNYPIKCRRNSVPARKSIQYIHPYRFPTIIGSL